MKTVMIDSFDQRLPTKILEPPRKAYYNGALMLRVVTDKGTFLSKDLAKLIGFENHHGWTQRLKAKGWEHPHILNPPAPKGFRISGEKMVSSSNPDDFGNEEWQALSDKSRAHKLKNIPDSCFTYLSGGECKTGCV